jgi:hypothetical protein
MTRRFKGMIRPGMALTLADSARIAERTSIWVVEYLRARRDPSRLFKAMARRKHLAAMLNEVQG